MAMRTGLFLGLVGSLAFGSVAPAIADSYLCTFKPNRIEKDIIPVTLRIDWPNYLGPAKITDNIGVENGIKSVHSELPVETAKRISFKWRLPQISVPNLGLLTGYASKSRMDVIYSANYYLASKKIILRADPLVPWKPTADFIRGVGRCTVQE